MSAGSGFLGTEATWVADGLLVSQVGVVPLLFAGLWLAASGRHRAHAAVMAWTFYALVVVVVLFVGYNLAIGMPAARRDASRLPGPLYASFVIGHVAIAIAALAMTGHQVRRAARRKVTGEGGRIALPPGEARRHRRVGLASLALLILTAATGAALYAFRYVL